MRRRLRATLGPAGQSPQRLPGPGLGHARRHRGVGDPQAAVGVLLPRVAAGAASPGRAGPGVGGRHLLSPGGVDAAGGQAGGADRHQGHLQKPGLADVEGAGRAGRGVPQPSFGGRAVCVRVGGRPDAEGPRGRPDRERARAGGHRGQRRRAPRDPGDRGDLGRGRSRLARLPARARRARPVGRPDGDLRCASRPGRGDRVDAAGRGLAAVPDALPAQPADQGAQVGAAVGGDAGADHLRPARRRGGPCPARTGRRLAGGQAPRRGRAPGPGQTRSAGLHRLPAPALAADLVQL